MLDIIFPVPIENVDLCPESLDRIAKFTDVPFRMIVVVDGGKRSDFAILESYLKGMDHDWTLVHNSKHEYLNSCLRSAAAVVRSQLAAIVPPEILIDDPKWFGKMQQVFLRDHICGIIDSDPNTQSATASPVRRSLQHPPRPGCRFAMLKKQFIQTVHPLGDVDPVVMWSESAMRGGGTAWTAPGVRYLVSEHTEHETWRAPLARRSKSQLPTTVDSSTPTTTESAGFKDFDLLE